MTTRASEPRSARVKAAALATGNQCRRFISSVLVLLALSSAQLETESMSPFFPVFSFGWAFFSVLVALLLVAAYIDFRTLTIPKSVVFAILGSGLLANLTRGIWLGTEGRGVFLFTESNGWLGALDGLLFSLVGFLTAFALLFVLWILKTCGGGDVKLMAALGAWLGPVLVVYVWLTSIGVLLVIGVGSLAVSLVSGKPLTLNAKKSKRPDQKPPKWRLSYSFPIALATVFVLLWCCRVDLGLAKPPTGPEGRVSTHAR